MKTITGIVQSIWGYFQNMNSEPGTTHISIKRNMAWGIATLLVFVEVYSLTHLPHATDTEIARYVYLCIVYSVIDAAFVVLALKITSVEKLQGFVQTIKGVVAGTPTLKGGDISASAEEVKEEKID